MTLEGVLAALAQGGPQAAVGVGEGVAAILDGHWNDAQIAAFLGAVRVHGDTPACIARAARVLRAHMIPVAHALPLVLDTCGTGGDGAHTLNLSTGAALVVSALGVPVAKHGNRSVSSRCGSADVLEAMGIPLHVPPSAQAGVLAEVGLAFLMAPAHHPALKHAARVRKELGVRTLFNGLGPLANPAGATHQVLGVYHDGYRATAAQVLRDLGSKRAWVVHSEDGMDEMSPSAPTHITALADGTLKELSLAPEDFGLSRLPRSAYAGGDAAYNANALFEILTPRTSQSVAHPACDAVILAAAAALVVATGDSPADAAARARVCIESGNALRAFERFRAHAEAVASAAGKP